jgi:hypothetical protein
MQTERSAPSTTAGEKEPLNHGVKVRAKVKRGTATRDQDEILIEGRGENAIEAAAEFQSALQMAEQNDWSERLRDMQAEGDGDE